MREIKFRAWNEESRTMHLPMTLSQIFQIAKTDELGFAGLKFKITFESMAFMQYTGFKDVNGKEVYEGDIIRYDLKEGLGEPPKYGLKREVAISPYGAIGQWDTNIRVVGNVYENLPQPSDYTNNKITLEEDLP